MVGQQPGLLPNKSSVAAVVGRLHSPSIEAGCLGNGHITYMSLTGRKAFAASTSPCR